MFKLVRIGKVFPKELESKDFSLWKNVLFTDGSKFNLFGSDGRPYEWRRSNEELLAENIKHTVKYGGWVGNGLGSFSASRSRVIHFIDITMD